MCAQFVPRRDVPSYHDSTSPQDLPHMNFRSFIEVLKEDDDLVEINDEKDPNQEVSAIIRRACETNDRAPLLNNLKGSREGLYRVLGAPASLRRGKRDRYGRLARHLGLPPDSGMKQVMDKMLTAKGLQPLPPNIVETGPCKENKLFGEQINLETFPNPRIQRTDSGKYIQTYGMYIVQSPDGSWTNWCISRSMVHDAHHMAGVTFKPHHIWQIHQMWAKQGKDTPWALALGVPPVATMAAGMPLPAGMTEAEYIGAVTGTALDLVKCETTDLYVPANSEIVLEGKISATEGALEGPFGEMHGYVFPSDPAQMPKFRVDCVTYRDDAIIPVCAPGRLTDDSHTMIGSIAAAEILQLCQDSGLPVLEAFTPFESQVTWVTLQIDTAALRKLKTNSGEFCRRVGDLVFSSKAGWTVRRIVLVGNDVDPFDFADVMRTFTTRCRPDDDEIFYDEMHGFHLIPHLATGEESVKKDGKFVSDALVASEYCLEREWETNSFEESYGKEVKDKVRSEWEEMGFRKV